jgi:C4-dicarboxylate-specific signal transduction histidine kinase
MSVDDLHILLIEDSQTDRILIEGLLREALGESCRITRTEQLADGLDCVTEEQVDAVMLDLTLPDSVGPGACERIRECSPDTPVIVLTGIDDEATALESLNRGAQDYLVKGRIDARLLSRAVRYAVERKRTDVELQHAHQQIDRQRHEAELAHLARLNTMGEMASGMAHELNQPLTALVGYAESAMTGLDSGHLEPDDFRHILERVVSESQRAAEIIRRLRRLVRKREPERTETVINDLVREVADMVAHETDPGGYSLQLELMDSIPVIRADRVQIQQVLLNLVRNGLEAMDLTPQPERLLIVRTEFTDRVCVTVSDNGPKHDPAALPQLFEPYYSTKATGLGMGLAICRSIIESHAGQLNAEPNANRGLSFTFTLPADERPPNERLTDERKSES